jgi:hypothetical protein
LRDGASRKGAGRAHDLVERAAALEEVDKGTASSPFRPDAFPVAQGRAPGRERQDSGIATVVAVAPACGQWRPARHFLQSIRGERSGDGDDEAARDSRPISRA